MSDLHRLCKQTFGFQKGHKEVRYYDLEKEDLNSNLVSLR